MNKVIIPIESMSYIIFNISFYKYNIKKLTIILLNIVIKRCMKGIRDDQKY